jgi:hypothetical protein
MVMFLNGMVTMGFVVAGLFFLRFWRRTADGLFIAFSAAFWLLALNQALASMVEVEEHSWVYLIRLVAFAILIMAIVAKNVGPGSRPTSAR